MIDNWRISRSLSTLCLHYGAPVAEWLERPLAVPHISGSIGDSGGRREPYDYVNFRSSVKGQRLHTVKHTIKSQEQHYNISLQTPIHVETGS